MQMLAHFFLSGFVLGLGVCSIHCSIMLMPVVARGSVNWKQGVSSGLFFGAGKTLVCGILGGIALYSGHIIRDIVGRELFALVAGATLTSFGIWFLFYRGGCGKFFKTGSPFLLGVVDGILPCGPMFGFLLYIASAEMGIYLGVLSGMAFGAGTVAGPVLAVCGIIPYLWRFLSRFSKAPVVLRILGAAIFFLWGIPLLFR